MTAAKRTTHPLVKWLRAGVVVCSAFGLGTCLIALCLMAATQDDGRRPLSFYQTETAEANTCQTQVASTLPQAVISDLCLRNLVPSQLARCGSTNVQLQRRDIETIVETAMTVGQSTYASVRRNFGNYELDCTDTNTFGNSYACKYDLTGNGPFVTISFDATTQIVKAVSVYWSDCSRIFP